MIPMPSVEFDMIFKVMGITFTLTTAVIAFLVRMLLKSYNDKITTKLETVQVEYRTKFASTEKNLDRIEEAVLHIQEQWSLFQKTSATLEATRSNRLDAMFRVLDHQKEEIRAIRPALLKKQQELQAKSMDDIKNHVYVVLGEIKDARRKGNRGT